MDRVDMALIVLEGWSPTGEIYPSGFLPVSAGNVRRDSCHEQRVDYLRPGCDRITVGTKNCSHRSRLLVEQMAHSDSGHASRIPITTSRPNTQAWTSSLLPRA